MGSADVASRLPNLVATAPEDSDDDPSALQDAMLGALGQAASSNEPGQAPRVPHFIMNVADSFVGFCILGDAANVTSVLEAGFSPNLLDSGGQSPLIVATEKGHGSVVDLLLTFRADPNVYRTDNYDYERSTALLIASRAGHSELVRRLVEAAANVHAVERGGVTALAEASEGGHAEVVRQLIAARADATGIISPGTNYMSPLMHASVHGHPAVVEVLSSAGVDLDTIDGYNHWTALTSAAHAGHLEVVELLWLLGASVNAADGMDRAALDIASRREGWGENLEIVQLLLEAGADSGITRGHHSSLSASMPPLVATHPLELIVLQSLLQSSRSPRRLPFVCD